MFTTQTISIGGTRLVVMEQAEFDRLCNLAGQQVLDDTLPPLPERDKRGLVPALEFTRISIARDIIRERKGLGLSQAELAKLAGLRQETISRLESGKHTAAPRTIDRIDAALKQARKQRKTPRTKGK